MRYYIFPLIFLVISCTNKKEFPNIILIVVDDLGWADLECYGSEFYETPNVDKLASKGIRFTHAYAASPVCSPTRAALMTGKHPATLNITDWIPGRQSHQGVKNYQKFIVPPFRWELPLEEVTIAEKLKELGYATAHIGKWHLGKDGYLPQDQGFDINIGGAHIGQPGSYFYPFKNHRLTHVVNGLDDISNEGDYLTDRLTDKALQFITDHESVPFFLYLPYYTVHTPIQGKEDLTEKYRQKLNKMKSSRQVYPEYAAMVHSMDENVGRILEKIGKSGLEEKTIIIFTSDNGGLAIPRGDHTWPTNCRPLREGKGFLYEGGVRIPAIIRWPGVIQGGTESDFRFSSIDIFPTIMEILGLEKGEAEGISLLPLITNGETPDRNTLYWHFPHYHLSMPASSIIKDDFKLIEYLEDNKFELYDLGSDPSETNDISYDMPGKVTELYKDLNHWREKVKAQMPIPNQDYVQTQ
ncbi:sulfatase [Bacteroidota bacterium]